MANGSRGFGNRWGGLRATPALAAAASLALASGASGGSVLHVDGSDPSCGGATPCFATIQAAIDAAAPGDVVRVEPGAYTDLVRISGKSGLTVEGHPDRPPDGVAIRPAPQPSLAECLLGVAAIEVDGSSGVTLRRLMVQGYESNGVRVRRSGGARIVGMRIVANGRPECGAGVVIDDESPGALLAHNLIHANRRDGVVLQRAAAPPPQAQSLWSNTIYGNGRHGLLISSADQPLLWNNLIVGNGSETSLARSFGIHRDATGAAAPLVGSEIGLWHNLVCGNRDGEIALGALEEPVAVANQTPTGSEGPGFVASPQCMDPAVLFERGAGIDETWGTTDDDFFLRRSSPAVNAGHATLPSGLDAALLRADFLETVTVYGTPVRPSEAHGDGAFDYDIGALEWGPLTLRKLPRHRLRARRVPETIELQH